MTASASVKAAPVRRSCPYSTLQQYFPSVCFLLHPQQSANAPIPSAPHLQDQPAKTVANGACGYGELSSELYPGFNLAGVALDSSVFKGKALKGCGTCVEIKCTDEVSRPGPAAGQGVHTWMMLHISNHLTLLLGAPKSSQVCDPSKVLTVMLYDNCDKCGPEQVNLQALPFKQLAPLDIGRIGIQFREVRECVCAAC